MMGVPAVERERTSPELLATSSKSSTPPPSAEIAVAGMSLQLAGTASSGILASSGRHGQAEGTKGLAGLLPVSANSARAGNGGKLNSVGFLPGCAPKVFDTLPQRAPRLSAVYEVPSEAGEVWERGPEMVVRDGCSVCAIFSSTPLVRRWLAVLAGCLQHVRYKCTFSELLAFNNDLRSSHPSATTTVFLSRCRCL